MDPTLVAVVERRRDRAIAAILGVKEREAEGFLPLDVSKKVRKVILDQLNDFTSLVLDVIESLTAGAEDGSAVVLNAHWLDKLEEIHAAVVGANGNGSG